MSERSERARSARSPFRGTRAQRAFPIPGSPRLRPSHRIRRHLGTSLLPGVPPLLSRRHPGLCQLAPRPVSLVRRSELLSYTTGREGLCTPRISREANDAPNPQRTYHKLKVPWSMSARPCPPNPPSTQLFFPSHRKWKAADPRQSCQHLRTRLIPSELPLRSRKLSGLCQRIFRPVSLIRGHGIPSLRRSDGNIFTLMFMALSLPGIGQLPGGLSGLLPTLGQEARRGHTGPTDSRFCDVRLYTTVAQGPYVEHYGRPISRLAMHGRPSLDVNAT